MEIIKEDGKIIRIEFVDHSGSEIQMWVEESVKQGSSTKLLWVDTDNDYFRFSREDIKTLLPYLQAFAQTGQLEPLSVTAAREHGDSLLQKYSQSQEPTLQGENLFGDIDQLHQKLKRENAILAATNKYVKDLKQLVREWKKYGQSPFGSKHPDELVHMSEQLLGESDHSPLQGEDELATMQEAANIVEQGKRIQALEQLVKEWRTLYFEAQELDNASAHHTWEECRNETLEKTSQLLGE